MQMIWRGRGGLVPVVAVGAAFLAVVISAPLQAVHPDVATAAALALWGVLAAAGIWFLAGKLDHTGEPRLLVNQSTGEALAVSADAGSLFSIPTRYWAFVAVGAGLLLAAVTLVMRA